jgi:hypothetical protein
MFLLLPQPFLAPPVPRVEHHDIGALPPRRPRVHGGQLERGLHPPRRPVSPDQVRRAEVLHGEVVVAEPEREEAPVLGDGVPVLLVHALDVGDGRGEHGLPLVPPDRVADEHEPPVPERLEQPRRVEPWQRAACRTPPPPGVLAVRPAVLGAPEPGVDERALLGLVHRVVLRVVAHPLAFYGHASEVLVAAVIRGGGDLHERAAGVAGEREPGGSAEPRGNVSDDEQREGGEEHAGAPHNDVAAAGRLAPPLRVRHVHRLLLQAFTAAGGDHAVPVR